MLPQAIDFRAEADQLNALLVTLTDAGWSRPTLFKQWTPTTSSNTATTASARRLNDAGAGGDNG